MQIVFLLILTVVSSAFASTKTSVCERVLTSQAEFFAKHPDLERDEVAWSVVSDHLESEGIIGPLTHKSVQSIDQNLKDERTSGWGHASLLNPVTEWLIFGKDRSIQGLRFRAYGDLLRFYDADGVRLFREHGLNMLEIRLEDALLVDPEYGFRVIEELVTKGGLRKIVFIEGFSSAHSFAGRKAYLEWLRQSAVLHGTLTHLGFRDFDFDDSRLRLMPIANALERFRRLEGLEFKDSKVSGAGRLHETIASMQGLRSLSLNAAFSYHTHGDLARTARRITGLRFLELGSTEEIRRVFEIHELPFESLEHLGFSDDFEENCEQVVEAILSDFLFPCLSSLSFERVADLKSLVPLLEGRPALEVTLTAQEDQHEELQKLIAKYPNLRVRF